MAHMLVILLLVIWGIAIPGEAAESSHHHESVGTCGPHLSPDVIASERFEGIQIETSAIAEHEVLFEMVLKAQPVLKMDHPQVDQLRAYCYRDVLIVIRQDLKTPRPSGWVQVNFLVPDTTAKSRTMGPPCCYFVSVKQACSYS